MNPIRRRRTPHGGAFLIFDGNSFTAQDIYPQITRDTLSRSSSSVNVGVIGQTTLDMISRAPVQVDARFRRDYSKNIVFAWEARNDIVVNSATAQTAYDHLVSYCQGRTALGFKVIIFTLLPSGGTAPADFETTRQTVNTNIRANWRTFAHALADVGSDPTMGQAGQQNNTTWYVDAVHPTVSGYNICANYAIAAARLLL